MKKTHRVIIVLLIVIIFLLWLIPKAVYGIKVQHLQNELTDLKSEWNKCEQIQLTNHEKAKEVRAKLNELLGISFTGESGITPETTTEITTTASEATAADLLTSQLIE